MKFSQYVALKENNISQEVEEIFQKTSDDIEQLFGQLYRGTEAMVRNSEKAKLPEVLQKSIMDDLKRIAQKVKGSSGIPPQNVRTDPRVNSENVMVDAYIKDILENISAVSGLGKTGTADSGKPIYDFKSTLNNVKSMIMDRMHQLKGSVLKAMGMVSDIHGQMGQTHKQIGDLHGNLVTNLKPQERESAEDGLVTIGGMSKSNNVKLYTGVDAEGKPTGPLVFNPRDRQAIRTVLSQINPKKVYASIGGKISPIDLTNRQSWTELQGDLQANVGLKPPAPVSGNKLRTRKIQDAEPGNIKVNNTPTMGS